MAEELKFHEEARILCPDCRENYLQILFSESGIIKQIRCVAVGTKQFSTCDIMGNRELFLALIDYYVEMKVEILRVETGRANLARKMAPINLRIENAILSRRERASQLAEDERARIEDEKLLSPPNSEV